MLEAQINLVPDSLYERGRTAMQSEDWYTATEYFLEALRLNPAHTESTVALAECYYDLREFDQALAWIQRARTLARNDIGVANLEAAILIALGQLEKADSALKSILTREPYNKEALFTAAELDIARGHSGDAVNRYREAVYRYPDDRRLLVSLALVLNAMGDIQTARQYIERAVEHHPDDYRVYYYASYLEAQTDNIEQALLYIEESLFYKPDYIPARSLLASLHYRNGNFEEAARIADGLIASNRSNISAWYLKSMAYSRLGREFEAMQLLTTTLDIDPNDEFARVMLEDLILYTTNIEDPRRARWATWHFNRARNFRTQNLIDQALFEYRRGLRLNPYARDRQEYADLLRIQGYPARYLGELQFMQDLGMGDRPLNDAVEAYTTLLENNLPNRWEIQSIDTVKRHWNIAVFSVASQSSFFHADAGVVGSSYIRELMIHERSINPLNLPLRQTSFSAGFREARVAGADYFLVVSVSENERDLSVKAELFVARTGSPAGTFYVYRTGTDRLRNAARGIVDTLTASLPFRAELIQYRNGLGLIDRGKIDGVQPSTTYDIVHNGNILIKNEGIGISYPSSAIIGTLVIDQVDEEVSSGSVTRNGFFDLVRAGDEVVLQPTERPQQPDSQFYPEIQQILRTLR
jgi:tetratricopeptide (TPR) repeat protein